MKIKKIKVTVPPRRNESKSVEFQLNMTSSVIYDDCKKCCFFYIIFLKISNAYDSDFQFKTNTF